MSSNDQTDMDKIVSPASAAIMRAWDALKVQLGPYSRVVAMREDSFNCLDETTRNFFVNSMMQETGEEVRYVRDISGGRVFLGSISNLTIPTTIILDMPNYDLPVMLPRACVLGGDTSYLPPVPASAQWAQNSFQPSYYGASIPPMTTQPGLAVSSQSDQPTATSSNGFETPTKKGRPAKKRKAATPKVSEHNPFDNGGDHHGGYGGSGMGVNLVQNSIVDNELTSIDDDFKIKHNSKYRKRSGKYRSNGPRPQNAFILYRSHVHKSVAAQNPGIRNDILSKLIGEMWRALPGEEKQVWKLRQAKAEREHKQIWPEYKYNPIQPWEKEQTMPQNIQQKPTGWKKQDDFAQNGMKMQLPLPTITNPTSSATELKTLLETTNNLNLLLEYTYGNALAAPVDSIVDNAAGEATGQMVTPSKQELGDSLVAKLEEELDEKESVSDSAHSAHATAGADGISAPSMDASVPPVDADASFAGTADLGLDDLGYFDLSFEDYTVGGDFDCGLFNTDDSFTQ